MNRSGVRGDLYPAGRVALGCFSLMMACLLPVVCLLLTVTATMVWQPIALSRQVAGYQSTQCTILSKSLLSHTARKGTVYAPHFTYTVHTIGEGNYQADGYGLVSVAGTNKTSQQAILDSYQVGATYPCWYDPVQPSHAVLNKDAFGPLLVPFMLGLFFSILIVLTGLLMLFLVVVFAMAALSPPRSASSLIP